MPSTTLMMTYFSPTAHLSACSPASISETRAEVGCVSYELLQLRESPCEFALLEEWESQEHLDAHTRTEHFVLAMDKLEALESARPALIYRRLL